MTINLFLQYILIFFASILAGFVNTLVGSGSLIMLPLLIMAGLPPNIANGTNRVAILVQSIVAVRTYFRKQSFSFQNTQWVIVPCLAGAILGAIIAVWISPKTLETWLGFLMLLMLGLILLKPEKWLKEHQPTQNSEKSLLSILVMFLVGIYGGFIQGGVGIFLMASMIMVTGYTLSKTNAIKLIIIALYSFPVLFIFIYYQQIDWFFGLFTSIGQGFGAYLGAKFATQSPQANRWTYYLLVVIMAFSVLYFFKIL